MKANLAPGLHVAPGQAANVLAYDGWVGRWSRLFVPTVIKATEVSPGCRVLDISTGTGEAALMTLPTVGASRVVIGADVAPAMLVDSRDRLKDPSFCPVAADGQALPFKSGRFDAVTCQPGLQFFADPARGLTEFRRVPEARGRERAFGTLQNRLPPELRLASITTIAEANRYLEERFLPEHNARFAVPAAEQTSVIIPYARRPFEDPVRSGNPPEPAPVKAIDAGELV